MTADEDRGTNPDNTTALYLALYRERFGVTLNPNKLRDAA